jgi:hypothetical protein
MLEILEKEAKRRDKDVVKTDEWIDLTIKKDTTNQVKKLQNIDNHTKFD